MSRYADAFKNANGPGDARPTAMQIVEDEGRKGTMTDKVFLLTGASAGIGVETGRALAATGARVFLGVRNLAKAQKACGDYLSPGRVELLELDTSSLASVRAAAAAFRDKSKQLNILACNAGIMALPKREVSVDGFELQLATNYLGHFLLFYLLKDLLLESSTPDFQSRLVNVSSSAHHATEVVWDDFQLAGEDVYTPEKAYGQSKLAQIWQANYVERTLGPKGLHAFSLMPGGIWTALQQHIPKEMMDGWKSNDFVNRFMKSEAQGAATTVWAALAKEWEGKGGKYLEDCRVASTNVVDGLAGAKEYVYDEVKEARLWKLTLETLGLEDA